MTKRTIEQRIEELEAKIEGIKRREERKKVRARPEVKHLNMALRSIDKGLNASEDQVLRKALDEARATVSSCLGLLGISPRAKLVPKRRAKPSAQAVALDSEQMLSYVRNNPGEKGEAIAAQFETDTATLRVVLRQLAADGAIRSEGKGRGTVYLAAGMRMVKLVAS
jgi:hypothetical protein